MNPAGCLTDCVRAAKIGIFALIRQLLAQLHLLMALYTLIIDSGEIKCKRPVGFKMLTFGLYSHVNYITHELQAQPEIKAPAGFF